MLFTAPRLSPSASTIAHFRVRSLHATISSTGCGKRAANIDHNKICRTVSWTPSRAHFGTQSGHFAHRTYGFQDGGPVPHSQFRTDLLHPSAMDVTQSKIQVPSAQRVDCGRALFSGPPSASPGHLSVQIRRKFGMFSDSSIANVAIIN